MWRSPLNEYILEVRHMNFSNHVKNVLFEKINEMSDYAWLFCKNPETDFSRNRKLSFETTMKFLTLLEGGSIKKELLEFFNYDPHSVTASAFVQQRSKILPEAFEFLFNEFNSAFPAKNMYKDHRLIACDGSDLVIAANPDDKQNYYQTHENIKGYSMLHLDACYDLCNRRYIDAIIQPGANFGEARAMNKMMDRYKGNRNTIFIADRGYESYNVFAHAEQNNLKYLIRVKDKNSNGMLRALPIPTDNEFDTSVQLQLTRKQNKEIKAHPEIYKFMPQNSRFDYFENNIFYPITLRILRFKISEDTYECIITNLSKDEFSAKDIKKLYHMRWGIETSFRELKYAIGLTSFHAKKVEYINQEIFARLTLYNVCEIITTHVIIQKKETNYQYQLNYSLAIHICRYFLRCTKDISPPDVEALIQKNLLPIRPGRKDPRKVKSKSAVSFLYRVA